MVDYHLYQISSRIR